MKPGMMNKKEFLGYQVKRTDAGAKMYAVLDAGEAGEITREIPFNKHLVRHSPTGFEFGYGGSGPAELAWQMLHHYIGELPNAYVKVTHPAITLYQIFKVRVIERLKTNDCFIPADSLKHFMTSVDTKRRLRNPAVEEWIITSYTAQPENIV